MSEPYAALAQVTIERAALIAYLGAHPGVTPPPADRITVTP